MANACPIFFSYNRHDKAWVEWIAWTVEDAGYSTVLQPWDFQASGNFVLDMQKAAIVYIDLVGAAETDARDLLRRSLSQDRAKPTEPPPFPQSRTTTSDRPRPVFPPSIPCNLPPVSAIFVGREEALKDLHTQLQTGIHFAQTPRQASNAGRVNGATLGACDGARRAAVDGEWGVGSGEWGVGNGEWG